MESFNLQEWTRIGAMNRTPGASFWSAPAERSADGALVRLRREASGKELAPHPEAPPRASSDLSPQAGRGNWTAGSLA